MDFDANFLETLLLNVVNDGLQTYCIKEGDEQLQDGGVIYFKKFYFLNHLPEIKCESVPALIDHFKRGKNCLQFFGGKSNVSLIFQAVIKICFVAPWLIRRRSRCHLPANCRMNWWLRGAFCQPIRLFFKMNLPAEDMEWYLKAQQI